MFDRLATAQLPPAQLLALLERHALDAQLLAPQPIYGQLNTLAWQRIDGLARFWLPQEHGVVARCMEDLLAGLYGCSGQAVLLIDTLTGQVRVHLGVQTAQQGLLEAALQGIFPGILLASGAPQLGSQLVGQGAFNHSGQLTGIPTLKTAVHSAVGATPTAPVQQIERLTRGLSRSRWGYSVHATPLTASEINNAALQVLSLLRSYDQQAHMTTSQREGVSVQGDRAAQWCLALLERVQQRLECGKAQGMWRVETTFFAPDAETLMQLAGLLRSVFTGAESYPDPMRARICQPQAAVTPLDDRQTLLHTRELSALMQLPTEEMPGYQMRDYTRFDVALPPTSSAEQLTLGEVLDGGVATGQSFSMPRDDLVKHGLIVGVTGSGKTNTCFGLLERVWDDGRGQPFLVIEPAKAEYRSLLQRFGNRLRVYTLGDERYAPFRLNPFEFECQDAEYRIHIQTHIDYLKSVFNAAFILYAPMPYVLETCLHEIYIDRGWNLTTSTVERRLPRSMRGQEADYAIFPTLQNLYAKIDPVVDRLGYDERIQKDVKAGLKARIGSLLLGSKGLMLNTRRSLPIPALLAAPTVLELERIGDDDEKAFVMGLLLTRLYEHRVVEGRKPSGTAERLRHVLLIEEAHRLLQNVATSQDTETANPRGKAVETFTNMLAEIRAYGQAVLIAEQIPTKLTPDAIKNTNLKVLHRTVAAQDRDVMAGAMNLDQLQTRAITTLLTGQAAIYAEGSDRPYLVQLARAKGMGGWAAPGKSDDSTIHQMMQDAGVFTATIYQPRSGCERCGLWQREPTLCATTRNLALTVQAQPSFSDIYRRYIRSLTETPARAVLGYPEVLQAVRQIAQPTDADEERNAALCTLILQTTEYVEQQGDYYGISYPLLYQMHSASLLPILTPIARNFTNDQAQLNLLMQHVAPKAQAFGALLHQLTTRRDGPFVGCVFCSRRCHFGLDIAPLAHEPVLQRDVLSALKLTDPDQLWSELADISQGAARRAVRTDDPEVAEAAALCFTAQVAGALEFSSDNQRKLVDHTRSARRLQGGAP